MKNVVFTVEQIQQILNALGEVPSKYGMGLISFIQQIVEPQLKEEAVTE